MRKLARRKNQSEMEEAVCEEKSPGDDGNGDPSGCGGMGDFPESKCGNWRTK